jgi:integrase
MLPDLLSFLLLWHTGLRGFDATDLRWADLDLNDWMLSRLTHKRKKQVWIPLHPELLFALEAESGGADHRPAITFYSTPTRRNRCPARGCTNA